MLLLPDCFLNNSSFPSVPSIYQASPCSLAPRKIFTMGWGLMRWIVSVRSVQLMGTFIPGALNGWLLYYIYSKDIGLVQLMIILQILVCRLHPATCHRSSTYLPSRLKTILSSRERVAY